MGQTDKWALPYPEADTLISVSAPIVQELAEKIDAALSAVTASDSYIIPGTLVGDFTTTGTFTPPPGVTVVHVAVVGGGMDPGNYSSQRWGGAGGLVRVYYGVPVSGDVAVTIGGPNTASTFGALSTPDPVTLCPNTGYFNWLNPDGRNVSHGGSGDLTAPSEGGLAGPRTGRNGLAGVQINGTYYCGGGGGGAAGTRNWSVGGAGGGGRGQGYDQLPAGGVNGLGGGAGAPADSYGASTANPRGGSGRVMVFTEQAYRATHDIPTPTDDPAIVAGLDDNGVMVGAYAVDPVAPVDTLGALAPMPDEPQPTGDTFTDPETGDTRPVLAWPEKGWTYIDGEWSPPND